MHVPFALLIDTFPLQVFPKLEDGKSRQIQDCNLQVVNCTTPANYFHALRRQIVSVESGKGSEGRVLVTTEKKNQRSL
jgi:2-oxoglutarate dehydrogenase complex dehydrogenase (E1) component-like enzyme